MRVLMAAMLIGCLLGVGTSTALSQSSPPWFGGRIELPEHGFAWTLPEGWIGLDPSADIDAQIDAALAGSDATDGPARAILRRELDQARAGGAQLVARDLEASWCTLLVLPSTLGLDEVEAEVIPVLTGNDRMAGVVGPDRLELPAGPASVVSWSSPPDTESGLSWSVTGYLFVDGSRLGYLSCGAPEAPPDRWLSVAETFQFIAQRYEHPEARVAVTWPLGWSVTEYDEPEEWGGLIWGTIGGDTMCQLADEGLFGGQDGYSLTDVAEAWRRRQDLAEPIDVSDLHPSVERAVRLDGDDSSRYLLVSGDVIVSLSCRAMPPSPQPPRDRWLSIAETIEFLAVEE